MILACMFTGCKHAISIYKQVGSLQCSASAMELSASGQLSGGWHGRCAWRARCKAWGPRARVRQVAWAPCRFCHPQRCNLAFHTNAPVLRCTVAGGARGNLVRLRPCWEAVPIMRGPWGAAATCGRHGCRTNPQPAGTTVFQLHSHGAGTASNELNMRGRDRERRQAQGREGRRGTRI